MIITCKHRVQSASWAMPTTSTQTKSPICHDTRKFFLGSWGEGVISVHSSFLPVYVLEVRTFLKGGRGEQYTPLAQPIKNYNLCWLVPWKPLLKGHWVTSCTSSQSQEGFQTWQGKFQTWLHKMSRSEVKVSKWSRLMLVAHWHLVMIVWKLCNWPRSAHEVIFRRLQ